jgi:hypothetical protein
MAAATITSQRTNVDGALREKYYVLTVADTNTLVTGLHIIRSVGFNDSLITKAAVSGGTITFSCSSTSTGALVQVTGL